MEIFNIGPGELIFIVVLMIILLGPIEMIRLTRRAGELIHAAGQSALWKDLQKLDREARELPYKLAREAGFDEQMEEIRKGTRISLDLYNMPEAPPGEVRSPGSGRLRPPQRRGMPAEARTETAAEGGEETKPVEQPASE
jgi:Sec-independent protein translocase protein TatA